MEGGDQNGLEFQYPTGFPARAFTGKGSILVHRRMKQSIRTHAICLHIAVKGEGSWKFG